jgi:YD repeat-containing protein
VDGALRPRSSPHCKSLNDSLQRLISSVTTGPEWGLSFTYDGFGNRTDSTVTKGTASLLIDGNTNRISTSGFSYDANGNLTAMPGGGC